MKSLLSIPLIFTCLTFAIAQDYYEGYLVSEKNDTIRTSLFIPSVFDINKNDSLQIYQNEQINYVDLSDIKYVFVKDYGFYEKKEFEFEQNDERTVFFEILVKGPASLYYYEYQDPVKFFLEMPDGEMHIISNEKNIIEKEGKKYTRLHPFINKLLFLLKDCPDLRPSISKARYMATSLTSLIGKYNECISDGSEFMKKVDYKKLMEIGPLLTYLSTKINFTNTRLAGPELDEITFNSGNFGIGAYFNFFPLRNNRTFAMKTNLYYSYGIYKTSSTYLNSNSTLPSEFSDFRMKLSDLNFNILITFFIPFNKNYLNIEVGPFYHIPVSGTTELTFIQKTLSGENEISRDIVNSSATGGIIGVAYQKPFSITKSITFYLQYSLGSKKIFAEQTSINNFILGIRTDLF